ncbi:MAG: helix-turn-helix transcriptional regulator [Firmicutes bacterium]|nr:helix-turn-helix transcriptional regulator [Bacillota bacterium]
MSIGERVKIIRKRMKLTQEEFAEALGVDHSHISRIEKSKGKISESLLKHICSRFFINRDWLETGKGNINVALIEVIKNYLAHHDDPSLQKDFSDSPVEIDIKPFFPLMVKENRICYLPDPVLRDMLKILLSFWNSEDDRLKNWAAIQFERAFSKDIVENVKQNQKNDEDCPLLILLE